ncbi:hypothetical protein M3N64_11380 [Sporolactobacillus sp. CPB3-1]|uniref:Uncharacterized protein n=1 Tax=Sporolactobacillus mangiferae TaxID=2940498 RepID=A0ABT0MCB9_9BACL|nr:hypothetical protein [Sporolactobacillus mangiferae]MCL1632520.1 hypothetical protein [Sporolactobacillus mangiferae]
MDIYLINAQHINDKTLELHQMYLAYWLRRYDYPVIPFTDNYFPSSLTSLPVTVMLLLQYRPVRNPFLNAFLYVVLSIIGLSIIRALGIVTLMNWNLMYSALIQYVIFICACFLTTRKRFDPLI